MKTTLKHYDQDLAILNINADGSIASVTPISGDYHKMVDDISSFLEERRYPASRPESRLLRSKSRLDEYRATRLSNSEDGIWLMFNDNILTWDQLLDASGATDKSGQITIIAAAPEGMQPKRLQSGFMRKMDLFPGEALSEVLLSLYLEASGETDMVTYRLGLTDGECVSPSYKPKYDYIPMRVMLEEHIRKTHPELYAKSKPNDRVLDAWYNHVYRRTPVAQRADIFCDAVAAYGISREDYLTYLSRMATLDAIFGNTDRHLNNFGIMYNNETGAYEPGLLFDNGRALGVGQDYARITKYGIGNQPAQPFATRQRTNIKAVPTYDFRFDVVKFLELYQKHVEPYELATTPQLHLFWKQLKKHHPQDVNGVDVSEAIDAARLEQAFIRAEQLKSEAQCGRLA